VSMASLNGFTCHSCKKVSNFLNPEVRLLSEAIDLTKQHSRNYHCSACSSVNTVSRTTDEWKVIDGRRI
jgi:hypothetical protein